MPKKISADHRDADLMLKVYDLRRDPVMRESRAAINATFWPKSFAAVQAVLKPDHPLNAAWRQTSTYWEMVYGIARHGIVNPDFWIESNGEGLYLFARVEPFLPKLREVNPRSFRNAEWMTTSCPTAKQIYAYYQGRVAQMLQSK